MATRMVSRGEFVAHIRRLVAGETTEPATLWVAEDCYNAAQGARIGQGAISFFVERGIPHVNDTQRGARMTLRLPPNADLPLSVFSAEDRVARWNEQWTSFDRIFDEEERIANADGKPLRWTIGEASDRIAPEKRVDPPGRYG